MTDAAAKSSGPVKPISSYPLYIQVIFALISLWVFLFLASLGNVILEWVGIGFSYWDLPGSEHAQSQVEDELSYLSMFATEGGQFMRVAAWLTGWLYHLCWSWSPLGIAFGLIDMAMGSDTLLDWQAGWSMLYAAAQYSVQVVALRLVISIFTIPAFLLVGAVAFIEGMVQRELRKYGGGAESSLIFHFAKRNIRPWIVTPWVLYLANPFSVHPNWIFMPCLVLFGFSVAITASKFKKVL